MKSLIPRFKSAVRLYLQSLASPRIATLPSDRLQLGSTVLGRSTRIPVSWARSSAEVPFSNLGDQLSAIIVAALTKRSVSHVNFDSQDTRLTAIGSIGHQQTAGTVHIWGTGFGSWVRNAQGARGPFHGFPDVNYVVHALRGPFSHKILANLGVDAPAIFGDPVWFLPRVMPERPAPRHELGVVMHISELAEKNPRASPSPALLKYEAGLNDHVKLISTYHDPSWGGFKQKLEEILSCRRIISRSLHGMLIAEAYGIPCAFGPNTFYGVRHVSVEEGSNIVDPRFADAYAGYGCHDILSYGVPKRVVSDWDKIIRTIDDLWEPIPFTGRELFDAFPLPKAVKFEDEDWSLPGSLIRDLEW
jgi:pyruvyltransferase